MPDADREPLSSDCTCPEIYPISGHSATPSLRDRIFNRIGARGRIPFPEYVEMALYDPELGYYAKSGSQVGREGDFYTSVSVGPMFGKLLARRFVRGWEEAGRPQEWRILEIGAHDGKLAEDILSGIHEIQADAWKTLEYAIAEPLPHLRELQCERLSGSASRLLTAANISELAGNPLPGFAFGNEILDALPFHIVEMTGGCWKEMQVAAQGGELRFEPQGIEAGTELSKRLELLRNDFPEGYRTEIRTNLREFLESLSICLKQGVMIFTDYGFAAPEYYDRSRTSGTLRTFSRHKAAEDPFDRPGEMDITAHVDFTALADAAAPLGYLPTAFSTQGSYLTHLAKTMIMEGGLSDPKSIAQFRSLTHPAHLGASFHAIELRQGGEIPPEVRHRLAL